MIGRRLRTLAAAAITVFLSACWSGPPLFTARDTVAGVIPDGRYIIREPTRPGEPHPLDQPSADDALRIRGQSDGSLRVTAGAGQERRDWQVLTVPLAGASDRRFILQVEDRRRNAAARRASYLMLDARATPLRLYIPPCDAEARTAVEGSGGYVSRDPQSASQCIFRDAAALRSQLQRVIASQPAPEQSLELVPLR